MRVVFVYSHGLETSLIDRVERSLSIQGIQILERFEVDVSSFDRAQEIFQALSLSVDVIIGFGGGKALDVAKYVSFLTRLPYIAVPTSLSNDGFCSPQSSLEFQGKRRSFPAAMPYGIVIDSDVCLRAPMMLWWAGIGDSVAKITAVHDWRLAFNVNGTPINDMAALLSDATVFQLIAKPEHDLEGIHLLATALMLNGIAMEICGSSRPASGSEHLISHALDLINNHPRLHGLQVGIATYIVSILQGGEMTSRIAGLFDATCFWNAFDEEPLNRQDWIEAIKMAPTIKKDYYTILSERDCLEDFLKILDTDPRIQRIFSK